MRRAQTSVEFLILLGFMFIVFAAVFGFTAEKVASANQNVELQSLIVVGQSILDEVLTADQVREGYTRTFNIPSVILDRPYLAMINGSRDLSLHSADYEFVFFLPVAVTINGGSDGFLSETNVITKDATGIAITAQ